MNARQQIRADHDARAQRWQVWLRGHPGPVAELTGEGELISGLAGIDTLLALPSEAALEQVYLTPKVQHPTVAHAIGLADWLVVEPRHRPGLLKDRAEGRSGRRQISILLP